MASQGEIIGAAVAGVVGLFILIGIILLIVYCNKKINRRTNKRAKVITSDGDVLTKKWVEDYRPNADRPEWDRTNPKANGKMFFDKVEADSEHVEVHESKKISEHMRAEGPRGPPRGPPMVPMPLPAPAPLPRPRTPPPPRDEPNVYHIYQGYPNMMPQPLRATEEQEQVLMVLEDNSASTFDPHWGGPILTDLSDETKLVSNGHTCGLNHGHSHEHTIAIPEIITTLQ